ncbi:hypothetical protein WL95_01675 [Burkholderia cepacia]|nr:hypothetical protein WL95_01675 [Burkholderia cepacia]
MCGRQSVRRKTCARRNRSGQGRAPCEPYSKAIRQLAAAPRLRSRSIVRAGIRARDRLRYVGRGRDRHAPGAALGRRRAPLPCFSVPARPDCIGPGRPRFRIRDSMSMAPAPRIARGTAMCTLID